MAFFANGSEGVRMDEQCESCIHQDPDAGCPIMLLQINFNYDQISNPKLSQAMNMLINKKGICQMKPVIEKYYRKRPFPLPEKLQMSLF